MGALRRTNFRLNGFHCWCSFSRSVAAGTRKLPRVKTRTSGRKLALFHEDGTVNLEALAHLGKRQSFPRTQSSYDRLGRIGNRTQRPPSAAAAAAKRSSRSDVDGLIPLQFVDDDQLTPRRRAERDSFLATLLKADDLTDEELNEIAHYLIPDDLEQQEEEESTPRPCLKKSRPRPKSAVVKAKGKGTAMNSRSLDQSARPKSVRFLTMSPLPLSEPRESSPPPPPSLPLRPQSSPGPSRSELKPSDPFHVASPLPSPRSLDSPDEVAYFHRIDSPPPLPASQELMPEPEVTYYDDAGEKIEEEPLRSVHGSDREKAGGVHGSDGEKGGGEGEGEGGGEGEDEGEGEGPGQCEESSSPRPAGSTPRSESSKRSASPASAPDPPERDIPEPPDTPRGEREAVATQSSPRSDTPSGVSSSASPRQPGLPGSSQSTPRQSSPPPRSQSPTPRESTSPNSDVKLPSGDSPATEGTSPCSSSTAPRPDSSAQSDVASPSPPTVPGSESAPNEESPPPRPSKKLRPKSGKRKKSPPEGLPKPAEQKDLPAPQERSEKETSPRPEQSESPPQGSPASPRHSPPVQEEPLSIPVISVTRGQLPSVPPRSQSPLVQASDTLPLGSADGQPQDNAADSLPAEGSSLPNTTREADASSSVVCSASSREKGRRKKDERMKIWLTKTSWDRHVECVEWRQIWRCLWVPVTVASAANCWWRSSVSLVRLCVHLSDGWQCWIF